MPQPLLATSKLSFNYNIKGFAHKLDCYMAYNDVLGQHQMVDRDGITTVLWSLGAQYLWDKFRAVLLSTDVPSPATVTLLKRVGAIYNVIDVATLTGAGSGGGATQYGNQSTWVVRDTAFKFIRFIQLENIGAYVGHYLGGLGAGTGFNAISAMLSGSDTDPSAPFRWLKSRGDRFVAASGTVIAMTFDTNRKIRRARGLA
jgi:hypothetical protein